MFKRGLSLLLCMGLLMGCVPTTFAEEFEEADFQEEEVFFEETEEEEFVAEEEPAEEEEDVVEEVTVIEEEPSVEEIPAEEEAPVVEEVPVEEEAVAEEAPRFAKAYAKAIDQAIVYADAEMTGAMGVLDTDAVVYVAERAEAETAADDVLTLWFSMAGEAKVAYAAGAAFVPAAEEEVVLPEEPVVVEEVALTEATLLEIVAEAEEKLVEVSPEDAEWAEMPTGLEVHQFEGGLLSFNWAGKASSYQLCELKNGKLSVLKTVKGVPGEEVGFDLTGVKAGVHTYAVRPLNGKEVSTEYALTDEITVIAAPAAPKAKAAQSTAEENAIDVSWNAVAGAVDYAVSLDNDKWYYTEETSFTITDVEAGSHSVVVRAYAKNGSDYVSSKPSAKVTVKVVNDLWAQAPVITVAKQEDKTASTVTLSWKAKSLAPEAYTVYEAVKTKGAAPKVIAEEIVASEGENTIYIFNVDNGAHNYYVVPVKDGVEGTKSANKSVTVNVAWKKAPTVSSIKQDMNAENTVVMTWKNAGAGLAYKVYEVVDGENQQIEPTITGPDAKGIMTATIEGVAGGDAKKPLSHQFKLSVYNPETEEQSLLSAAKAVKVIDKLWAFAPTISVAKQADKNSSTVHLEWKAKYGSKADRYYLFEAGVPGGGADDQPIWWEEGMSADIGPLSNGAHKFYVIPVMLTPDAEEPIELGTKSAVKSVTVNVGWKKAPTAVTAVVENTVNVKLTWKGAVKVMDYAIYDNNGKTYLKTVHADTVNGVCVLENLAEGEHIFSVCAVAEGEGEGAMGYAKPVSIKGAWMAAPVLDGVGGALSATLTWTTRVDAAFYNIYEVTGSGKNLKFIPVGQTNLKQFLVTDLTPGAHRFAVEPGKMIDGAEVVGEKSNIVTVQVSDINPEDLFDIQVINEGTCAVSGYAGSDANLVIPATIRGAKVVEIADGAFKGNTTLKTVKVEGEVTRIGESAFEGCVNLESIVLPDSVEVIAKRAFKGCTKLSSMNN